ncbi:unnamed protein product [Vitrella brassicaformis CCMP3155]|uniref:MORN repeat-containing protein n=2 Tax=Vitrella brassicaformis TaxID=1169539 RepID=A0A0G4G036_VITBC|nr:unnamed protein product [Vitrella brassicaformis CCMP3155]|eukprot:CEM20877.1 unnamed protein product [Vitrella brassicaformis CCMP3155]
MSVVFAEGASPSVVTMGTDVLLALSQDQPHTQQKLIEELTRQRDELRGELDAYKRRLDEAEQRNRQAQAQIRDLEAQRVQDSAVTSTSASSEVGDISAEMVRQQLLEQQRTQQRLIEEVQRQRDEYRAERDASRQRHDQAEQRRRQAEARSQELAAQLARREESDGGPLVPKTIVWGGRLYYGSLLGGKPDGAGVLRTVDGSRKLYEGEWRAGCRQGAGTSYYWYYNSQSNPAKCSGQWKQDHYNGQGTSHQANGDVEYDGQWICSKRHGQGTLYDVNSNQTYTGGWVAGKMHGEGEMTRHPWGQDGKMRYTGQTLNGEPHGRGKLEDGRGAVRHEGQWVKGAPAVITDGLPSQRSTLALVDRR